MGYETRPACFQNLHGFYSTCWSWRKELDKLTCWDLVLGLKRPVAFFLSFLLLMRKGNERPCASDDLSWPSREFSYLLCESSTMHVQVHTQSQQFYYFTIFHNTKEFITKPQFKENWEVSKTTEMEELQWNYRKSTWDKILSFFLFLTSHLSSLIKRHKIERKTILNSHLRVDVR